MERENGMNKAGILHIPLSQYAYAEEEGRLTIRLRAQKDDIRECRLFWGDRVCPREPVDISSADMEKIASDRYFDYFEVVVTTGYTRVCYYFGLSDGKETVYYYGLDFCEEMKCHRTEYFQFPYIRREDLVKMPVWAEDCVIYHIFPDSFASGRRRLERAGKEPVAQLEKAGKGKESLSMLGGTLKGVTENLDYLQEMGINCIYMNPIFKAGSYHRYDTADYFQVDPSLGTEEDLKELVEACHRRGIRVLLDGVFNHCGPDFPPFRDVCEKGEASAYRDWFYRMEYPVQYQDPPEYETFAYVKEMPKLNTGNPVVEEYLCRVGTEWIRRADIDGWRLDVANEINYGFWRSFRRQVKAVKQDAFLIGEIWEDSGRYLMGDQFDSTMNYMFTYLCRDFFATGSISASAFDQGIQGMLMRYPEPVSRVQMNFLDSHDIPRFLEYCGGNERKMLLAMFYMMMSPGVPSIFYGDEKGIRGSKEREYRAAMPWEEKGFTDIFSKMIRLRREKEVLRKGSYRCAFVRDEEGIYAFYRCFRQEKVLVIMNNSREAHEVTLADGGYYDLTAEKTVDGTMIKLGSWEGKCLELC